MATLAHHSPPGTRRRNVPWLCLASLTVALGDSGKGPVVVPEDGVVELTSSAQRRLCGSTKRAPVRTLETNPSVTHRSATSRPPSTSSAAARSCTDRRRFALESAAALAQAVREGEGPGTATDGAGTLSRWPAPPSRSASHRLRQDCARALAVRDGEGSARAALHALQLIAGHFPSIVEGPPAVAFFRNFDSTLAKALDSELAAHERTAEAHARATLAPAFIDALEKLSTLEQALERSADAACAELRAESCRFASEVSTMREEVLRMLRVPATEGEDRELKLAMLNRRHAMLHDRFIVAREAAQAQKEEADRLSSLARLHAQLQSDVRTLTQQLEAFMTYKSRVEASARAELHAVRHEQASMAAALHDTLSEIENRHEQHARTQFGLDDELARRTVIEEDVAEWRERALHPQIERPEHLTPRPAWSSLELIDTCHLRAALHHFSADSDIASISSDSETAGGALRASPSPAQRGCALHRRRHSTVTGFSLEECVEQRRILSTEERVSVICERLARVQSVVQRTTAENQRLRERPGVTEVLDVAGSVIPYTLHQVQALLPRGDTALFRTAEANEGSGLQLPVPQWDDTDIAARALTAWLHLLRHCGRDASCCDVRHSRTTSTASPLLRGNPASCEGKVNLHYGALQHTAHDLVLTIEHSERVLRQNQQQLAEQVNVDAQLHAAKMRSVGSVSMLRSTHPPSDGVEPAAQLTEGNPGSLEMSFNAFLATEGAERVFNHQGKARLSVESVFSADERRTSSIGGLAAAAGKRLTAPSQTHQRASASFPGQPCSAGSIVLDRDAVHSLLFVLSRAYPAPPLHRAAAVVGNNGTTKRRTTRSGSVSGPRPRSQERDERARDREAVAEHLRPMPARLPGAHIAPASTVARITLCSPPLGDHTVDQVRLMTVADQEAREPALLSAPCAIASCFHDVLAHVAPVHLLNLFIVLVRRILEGCENNYKQHYSMHYLPRAVLERAISKAYTERRMSASYRLDCIRVLGGIASVDWREQCLPSAHSLVAAFPKPAAHMAELSASTTSCHDPQLIVATLFLNTPAAGGCADGAPARATHKEADAAIASPPSSPPPPLLPVYRRVMAHLHAEQHFLLSVVGRAITDCSRSSERVAGRFWVCTRDLEEALAAERVNPELAGNTDSLGALRAKPKTIHFLSPSLGVRGYRNLDGLMMSAVHPAQRQLAEGGTNTAVVSEPEAPFDAAAAALLEGGLRFNAALLVDHLRSRCDGSLIRDETAHSSAPAPTVPPSAEVSRDRDALALVFHGALIERLHLLHGEAAAVLAAQIRARQRADSEVPRGTQRVSTQMKGKSVGATNNACPTSASLLEPPGTAREERRRSSGSTSASVATGHRGSAEDTQQVSPGAAATEPQTVLYLEDLLEIAGSRDVPAAASEEDVFDAEDLFSRARQLCLRMYLREEQ